ncbi:FAD-dependent oxidoreductase [Arenibaculum sp.]|jgi:glycine/D-amino acid oxidase-like deaminating enzyme|uniref:NAD(P)/FAD-dependent oxidoreductase n=1 Tax=Arenibaculum sp. TaxID=2865862 RepID=UPI002E1671B8|nr:FAD-dependent oxidoreductase [Arenibaculum sp.]
MKASFDTIVLGGGVVGACVAAALAELDLNVVLVDRGCIGGQGASRYSGGIVRLYDPDDRIQALAVHSFGRMTDTPVGRAFASSIVTTGVYYALDERPADEALEFGRDDEADIYRGRIVSRHAAFEATGAVDPRGDGPVIWEPGGGYGDVRASARAVIQHLRRTGTVLENAAPREVEDRGDSVVVHFDLGSISARCAVVATGAWANGLLPGHPTVARSIPMVRMHCGRNVPTPVIDTGAASYMVPAGRGFVQVGSRARSEADGPDALGYDDDAIVADACERLARITGQPAFGDPVDIVRGFDGYTGDGRPLLGRVGEGPLFAAVGFSGIGYKLAVGAATLLARQVERALRGGTPSERETELCAPFDPSRFHAVRAGARQVPEMPR